MEWRGKQFAGHYSDLAQIFGNRQACKKGYIPFVLKMVRESGIFFIAATVAAIIFRLIFIFRFSSVTTDSFIYGDIAKNWLQHGIYGISYAGGALPPYIRLP